MPVYQAAEHLGNLYQTHLLLRFCQSICDLRSNAHYLLHAMTFRGEFAVVTGAFE
jgi:hypothetical protein